MNNNTQKIDRKPRALYTAKVAAVTPFEDTDSLSVLMVLKTKDGKAIKDKFVGKSFPAGHPVVSQLEEGDEIAFKARSTSKQPVAMLGDKKTPKFALNGLDKKSISILLPTEHGEDEHETDEKKIRQKEGLTTRAREFMANLLKAAAGV